MITSPKEILAKSKVIRRYLLLWKIFIAGILMLLPFWSMETNSALRYIPLAGFLLSAGSFIGSMLMIVSIQPEIKYLYPNTIGKAKRFLFGLFYFSRLPILFVGLFILVQSFNQEKVLPQNLVEIEGEIAKTEITKSPTLKISLEDNTNQYSISESQIPENNFQQAETVLKPGDIVFLLIERDDVNAVNDQYVQVYAIRTEKEVYLSLNDYQLTASAGNIVGIILGIFFSLSGLVFLLTGKIYKYKP